MTASWCLARAAASGWCVPISRRQHAYLNDVAHVCHRCDAPSGLQLTVTDSVACFCAVQWQVRHQCMVDVHVTHLRFHPQCCTCNLIALAALCTCMHICNVQFVCGFVVIHFLISCEDLQRLGLQGPQVPWQASHRIRGEPPVLSFLLGPECGEGCKPPDMECSGQLVCNTSAGHLHAGCPITRSGP